MNPRMRFEVVVSDDRTLTVTHAAPRSLDLLDVACFEANAPPPAEPGLWHWAGQVHENEREDLVYVGRWSRAT